ncbi:hypothetical protein EMQ25_03095 [Arsenicitalea aurantiaca]|uniref:Uncharacterized protein n=1 Tax=Arsenicitalea aurantiaca TaxID=1783274 RepID=A0A433XLJ7_9HYPH|nr:hypothetical protein [Arsenicitalea aurantiaca]RUT34956.1 hypothetical protein EMQ25_03095 [Arsenicitalea aurantiaca]
MSVARVAFTAIGLAMTVARNPVLRAGIRAAATNPRTRAMVTEAALGAAYTAGVVARRIVPRKRID